MFVTPVLLLVYTSHADIGCDDAAKYPPLPGPDRVGVNCSDYGG